MFTIKQIPEDFFVRELIKIDIKKQGKYKCYLLKKKNFTTLKAIEIICRKFNLNLKDIGYCGNKDKNALTEQFISARTNKNIEINNEGLKLEFLGHLDNKISLGNNLGNYFEIIVRNLDKKYNKMNNIVNYFDDQRFSRDNVLIGKLLLKRKFKEVSKILKVKSINEINKKILRFYIHSFQSYLFNLAVSNYISKYKNSEKLKYSLGELFFLNKYEKIKFPLASFDAKFSKKDRIYLKLLKKEDVKLDDFIIRQFPYLIEETVYRDVFVKIKDFKILNYEKDELNPEKFKEKISFFLPKGSYATMVIKQMF